MLKYVPLKQFRAASPQEQAEVEDLRKRYTDWHWSLPATKIFRVADKMVPNVVAIGKLEQLDVGGETFDFSPGSWVAFDPKHPHERIHLILSPDMREAVRNAMKRVKRTVPIQNIARSTRGTHARYPLPNLQGVDLGTVDSITYQVAKGGDGLSSYIHAFGEQHAKGVKPKLAADVSGRLWLAGGSARAPLAGVTG